jgi:Rps23 Pro-64 3,4-dihydroxylase Tpa1-like proline 4-hydroxylase|tara:strand:+ start:304 stop:951 length:648 start_codon:yes stop_codon:yes gene_type:complete
MKFEFIYEPVHVIIIRDIFTKKENKEILAEAVKNKKNFSDSFISAGNVKDFRNNKSAFYDNIYDECREKSKLLKRLDKLFSIDGRFRDMMVSSQYPMHLFGTTNYHETQVSRYGDGGQFYKYHIDSFNNNTRQLTAVYYFNEEPKAYKGGEIVFTRSPLYKGKVMDDNETPLTITPENNMMVIFGSHTPHTVLPTTSPKAFGKGRFSVNCWLGTK